MRLIDLLPAAACALCPTGDDDPARATTARGSVTVVLRASMSALSHRQRVPHPLVLRIGFLAIYFRSARPLWPGFSLRCPSVPVQTAAALPRRAAMVVRDRAGAAGRRPSDNLPGGVVERALLRRRCACQNGE
jgi:hypothetical protein